MFVHKFGPPWPHNRTLPRRPVDWPLFQQLDFPPRSPPSSQQIRAMHDLDPLRRPFTNIILPVRRDVTPFSDSDTFSSAGSNVRDQLLQPIGKSIPICFSESWT